MEEFFKLISQQVGELLKRVGIQVIITVVPDTDNVQVIEGEGDSILDRGEFEN